MWKRGSEEEAEKRDRGGGVGGGSGWIVRGVCLICIVASRRELLDEKEEEILNLALI